MLNFLYKDTGGRSATSVSFEGPPATILDQPSRHIFMGKISSQNKSIIVKVQSENVPSAMLESIAMRRSRRNMTVSDGESDIEITPVPSRKRSRVLTEEPRPLSEVDDEDNSTDDSTSNDTALQLFNLGHLKELRNGEEDYEWDSRR